MKIFLLLFLVTGILFNTFADDSRYQRAMEKNISAISSANETSDFISLANSFERIANAEKNKWLPYYYSAYLLSISSFMDDTTAAVKDSYLEKAEKYAAIADSLEPDNSEIYTLMGMIAQARMVVDPQNRWMKYGQISTNYLKKAVELDPANPRPDFLTAQSTLNTPEQFGGGKKNAVPIFKKALEKYEKFEPVSSLHPDWGEEMTRQILERIDTEEVE